MDMHFLRNLLERIDAIPDDDINGRYDLLCDLLTIAKKEASSPASHVFRSTNILSALLRVIENIPEDNREQRYFQLVSLMIFIKRQARLNPQNQSPPLHNLA